MAKTPPVVLVFPSENGIVLSWEPPARKLKNKSSVGFKLSDLAKGENRVFKREMSVNRAQKVTRGY